ncbi:MAG: rhodanese-like domain-containing protein [Clostridia bacterium]|nr:rhodanese-like domain-containing protein [Clostridia bacterium]
MKKTLALLLAAVLLVPAGCSPMPTEDVVLNRGYTRISQEEARKMMEREDGHIVLDVRRQDEYDAGHIPGAILLPNESIGTERPEELPDPDQIILIYCRSGNRSKQAAKKLADMGYTNVYEFGGITEWTGDITK